MAIIVQERTAKVIYFSLRWYNPDQVQRVKSQSVDQQTPLKYEAKLGIFPE